MTDFIRSNILLKIGNSNIYSILYSKTFFRNLLFIIRQCTMAFIMFEKKYLVSHGGLVNNFNLYEINTNYHLTIYSNIHYLFIIKLGFKYKATVNGWGII